MTCPHCFRFTLDPYLLDLFESARRRTDVRVLRLLPRLSDASRRIAAEGGQLNLTGENWRTAVRTTESRARRTSGLMPRDGTAGIGPEKCSGSRISTIKLVEILL